MRKPNPKAKKLPSAERRAVRVEPRSRSRKGNRHRGASVESFLREEGLYQSASTQAIKEVLAWQIRQAMERQGISKAEMARRMGTSRSALDRLLDPSNESLALATLFRAAAALGCELRVELRDKVAS